MSRDRAPSIAHFSYVWISVTSLEAILLGIIQGLTEFLPVSSSGHLILVQHLLGLEDLHQYVFFDLVCHLGTLLAIICVFFRPLTIILKYDWKQVGQVCLAVLPLFPLVLLLKPIKDLFNAPEYLGLFFWFTAVLLYLGIKLGRRAERRQVDASLHTWRDAGIIGLFQAFAILPGVSRSGSTISGARMLGWDASRATLFSFMLAIPTILGGVAVELLHSWKSGVNILATASFAPCLWGFVISFIVGYFSLNLLIKLAAKDRFMYFVWYCIGIGLFTLLYTNL